MKYHHLDIRDVDGSLKLTGSVLGLLPAINPRVRKTEPEHVRATFSERAV